MPALARRLRVSNALIASALVVTCLLPLLTACDGGSRGPPAPKPDFALSISQLPAFAVVGNSTSPVTLSVLPQHGFNGLVTITMEGIPHGVTVSPSSSFSLTAGASQSLTFSVSASAAVGTSSITAVATSDALSHSAQLMLTAAMVRTYQNGSVLYLESGTAADTARIALETLWGGTIVEVSVNGTEFVNRHDTGREVQVSYRDGNDPNWNPTLGGDVFNQGTPTIAYNVSSNFLYTKALPLQWCPQCYGRGFGQPVAGDVLVEQTITAVANLPHTFKAHYKATHLGTDTHANVGQEFPAVYTNQNYSRFIYYGSTAPWTNDAVTVTQFPDLPAFSPVLYVPERWGALVDAQDKGLTVYVPSQYPYVVGFASPDPGPGGPTDNATNYFAPTPTLTLTPNFVFEGDIYLIAGHYVTARQIIYQLHRVLNVADLFTPMGATDQPSPGTVTGITPVNGWAFDDVGVSTVEVLVDGAVDGAARYGLSRPDVSVDFPHAPVNCGFSYSLDSTKYSNGPHTLNVRVTDGSGNVAIFAAIALTVSN